MDEITYKDLTKEQLANLKERYVDSRVTGMSESELRDFVSEVLALQVLGTVGSQEEAEVWQEMKYYFEESFELHVKEVVQVKGGKQKHISVEKEQLQERLAILERRRKEDRNFHEDMWDDS